MKKIKLTQGFTLIELLVVIAIIGILGAIVYAPFQTARKKGRDAQKISELKGLTTSLAIYSDDHQGEYPNCLAQLTSYGSIPSNSNTDSDINCGAERTIEANPNKYNYTTYYYTDSNSVTHVIGYHLWTHLETLSPALSGSSNCSGTLISGSGSPDNASKFCIIGSNNGTQFSSAGTADYEDSYIFKYDKTWTDSSCKDTKICIYDLSSQ